MRRFNFKVRIEYFKVKYNYLTLIRAGETMEQALTKVTKGIKLGKILIQTNPETKNPELYYLRLPRGIKHDHCVLMDASITTGSAGLVMSSFL